MSCCEYWAALEDGSLASRFSEGILLAGNFKIMACPAHADEAQAVLDAFRDTVADMMTRVIDAPVGMVRGVSPVAAAMTDSETEAAKEKARASE